MKILQLAVDCWNRREAARIASLKLLQELNRAVATRKVRQRTIAKQTGVSDAFVSDVLKGKRNISDALLGRILKADFATNELPTESNDH